MILSGTLVYYEQQLDMNQSVLCHKCHLMLVFCNISKVQSPDFFKKVNFSDAIPHPNKDKRIKKRSDLFMLQFLQT